MSGQSTQSRSTILVPPSRWASGDFQLAAGCCMIQPSTGNVVVVQNTASNTWLLPRGRKDAGETLEEAAFREGYEESGFKPEPLPLLLSHKQPHSPDQIRAQKANKFNFKDYLTTTEPVYITTIPVPSGSPWVPADTKPGDYEYVCFWYAASVPPDAESKWKDGNTSGIENEENYIGQLVSIARALEVLPEPERFVMKFTYDAWLQTKPVLESEANTV